MEKNSNSGKRRYINERFQKNPNQHNNNYRERRPQDILPTPAMLESYEELAPGAAAKIIDTFGKTATSDQW
jgi:uncharacterized membrane protein